MVIQNLIQAGSGTSERNPAQAATGRAVLFHVVVLHDDVIGALSKTDSGIAEAADLVVRDLDVGVRIGRISERIRSQVNSRERAVGQLVIANLGVGHAT